MIWREFESQVKSRLMDFCYVYVGASHSNSAISILLIGDASTQYIRDSLYMSELGFWALNPLDNSLPLSYVPSMAVLHSVSHVSCHGVCFCLVTHLS